MAWVIGTKQHYFRDLPDDDGRYYHGNLVVHAPMGNYRCAIDVDPKNMPAGIQWRRVKIRVSDFAGIRALSDGWHPLASNQISPSGRWTTPDRQRCIHPS